MEHVKDVGAVYLQDEFGRLSDLTNSKGEEAQSKDQQERWKRRVNILKSFWDDKSKGPLLASIKTEL